MNAMKAGGLKKILESCIDEAIEHSDITLALKMAKDKKVTTYCFVVEIQVDSCLKETEGPGKWSFQEYQDYFNDYVSGLKSKGIYYECTPSSQLEENDKICNQPPNHHRPPRKRYNWLGFVGSCQKKIGHGL